MVYSTVRDTKFGKSRYVPLSSQWQTVEPDCASIPLLPCRRSAAKHPVGLALMRGVASQAISTIRRTGRLLTPSMPVSSSTLPGRPPQPS